jgi:hypothetical protein
MMSRSATRLARRPGFNRADQTVKGGPVASSARLAIGAAIGGPVPVLVVAVTAVVSPAIGLRRGERDTGPTDEHAAHDDAGGGGITESRLSMPAAAPMSRSVAAQISRPAAAHCYTIAGDLGLLHFEG